MKPILAEKQLRLVYGTLSLVPLGKTSTTEYRAKIAQMLILGIKGQELTDIDDSNLRRIAPGGVILFKHNYADWEQLRQLNQTILERVESNTFISPWISVDQEGGRVLRFGEPFTPVPPQSHWGKRVGEYAACLAKELRAAGLCVNYSPVVDITQNESLVIGDRAFSSQASEVVDCAKVALKAYRQQRVLGVIKHFPGHGAVSEDSHYEQPLCYKNLAELKALDLIPFQKLIQAGCEALMTAHIRFPRIDNKHIVTFSKKFLQEILREEFQYTGLIVSDDLEMKAVSQDFSYEESALKALLAGCDCVFLCHRYMLFEKVYEYLVQQFEKDVLSKKQIDNSWQRIHALKKKYLITSQQLKNGQQEIKLSPPA